MMTMVMVVVVVMMIICGALSSCISAITHVGLDDYFLLKE